MNVWNFTGYLSADVRTSATKNGTTVADFRVPVKSGYGKNEKTTWVNCVLFGKRAESALIGYLIKGQQVAISGEVTLEEWTHDGIPKHNLKVRVNEITLIGDRNSKPQQAAQQPQQPPPRGGETFMQEDVPFNPHQQGWVI